MDGQRLVQPSLGHKPTPRWQVGDLGNWVCLSAMFISVGLKKELDEVGWRGGRLRERYKGRRVDAG